MFPPAHHTPRRALRRGLRRALVAVGCIAALSGCDADPVRPPDVPVAPQALYVPIVDEYDALSAGNYHNCALNGDGAAVCWGNNPYGEAPAHRAASVGAFTQVTGGVYSSCALRRDGAVECWGRNEHGQAPPVKTAAAGATFTQVSAGHQFACALRSDGAAACWGSPYHDYGQAPAERLASTAGTGGRFTQVSAGRWHTCALRDDGVAECWGQNYEGKAPATRAASAPGTRLVQVSATWGHSCALRDDGVVECWGGSSRHGEAPDTRAPTTGGAFTQVTVGHLHTCALRSDGVVECWGQNYEGKAPATRAAGTGTFTQVSAGDGHTCGLTSVRTVECWGNTAFDEARAPGVRVLPAATFTAPDTVKVGQRFELALTGAHVPGHPEVTSFTYYLNCGDWNTYSTGADNSIRCPTSTPGTRTVWGNVTDPEGHTRSYVATVRVVYPFSGFLSPVEGGTAVNVVKAGSAIPVRFGLEGDRGLAIFADGYPKSGPIACDADDTPAVIEQTVNALASGLTYDAAHGRYTYTWKTERGWAGSCRRLTVRLADGTDHTADFRFTK